MAKMTQLVREGSPISLNPTDAPFAGTFDSSVSISPVLRQRTPKHLFRLHEGFHLALVLRHSYHRYAMRLD